MNKLILALLTFSFVTTTCDAALPPKALKSKREYNVTDKKGKCIKTKDKQITKANQKKLAKQQALAKQKQAENINANVNTNANASGDQAPASM